jgi:heat shock protein HtpX
MWELINSNKRKSIFLFIGLGIVLILLGYAIGGAYIPDGGAYFGVFFAFIIWGILSTVSYFAGSKVLLAVSGAKEVTKDVHPQLFNIVEEMKIASGWNHMPKVYIINSEAPNAFATGVKPDNTAIAVTAGLLARLNRDELQGVVAHEMSHIVNRDVLFMTFAGVMLGSIVLISQVFLRSMWYTGGGSRYKSKSSSSGGQAQLIFLAIAILFAILAPIMAQLLYFAISRKREYLADASAVRLTRYPEGLASALEKISISTEELTTANKVTAPMYIVNPLKPKGQMLSNLTSTHPPITERVRILRNIGQGANFMNYQQAFDKVKGKHVDIIPKSALADTSSISFREAGAVPLAGLNKKQVHREAGDIMMKANEYTFINCNCGVIIKVPPEYKREVVVCPKCRKKHSFRRNF